MELKGKTVLVTGATGGIGAAICRSLAPRIGKLVITGRNSSKLTELANDFGCESTCIPADMATQSGREVIINACTEQGVDIFINAAGTLDFNLLESQSPAMIESMVQLNMVAPMLLAQSLVPILSQRPESAMVFVGSTFGSIGHPGFSAYCASKFGLRGFVESLRRETSDSTMSVFYLAPRATRTDLNSATVNALNESLGNASDPPETVADALLTLLNAGKGRNAYIGWPEKLFVRINSLLPSVVDGALAKKLKTVKHHANSVEAS